MIFEEITRRISCQRPVGLWRGPLLSVETTTLGILSIDTQIYFNFIIEHGILCNNTNGIPLEKSVFSRNRMHKSSCSRGVVMCIFCCIPRRVSIE